MMRDGWPSIESDSPERVRPARHQTLSLRKTMAGGGDALPVTCLFRGREHAPQCRFSHRGVKSSSATPSPREPVRFRLVVLRLGLTGSDDRDVGEGLAGAPPLLDISIGGSSLTEALRGHFRPEHGQLLRRGIGERPEENRVEDAEDRGVCPKPQCEGKDRYGLQRTGSFAAREERIGHPEQYRACRHSINLHAAATWAERVIPTAISAVRGIDVPTCERSL